jgi:hypothetical protein
MKTRYHLRQYVDMFSNTSSIRRRMIIHFAEHVHSLSQPALFGGVGSGMLTHQTAQRHNEAV